MKDHKIIYLIYSRGTMYSNIDCLVAIYDNEKSAKEHIEKEGGCFLEIEEDCLYTKYEENK